MANLGYVQILLNTFAPKKDGEARSGKGISCRAADKRGTYWKLLIRPDIQTPQSNPSRDDRTVTHTKQDGPLFKL